MSLTIFAQRMKQAREAKELKQNELAKAVGVTPTTISAYEKSDDEGNGKKPTLENAQAIAEKLDVSLDWLCGMSDNDTTSYTDFTAKDYFKSLITVLMETSSVFDDTLQNGIVLNNPDILLFSKKISDLIKVYRAGSIPEDLFNVCIEKIINDYRNYTVFGNCVLQSSEYIYAYEFLIDLYRDEKIDTGTISTTVPKVFDGQEPIVPQDRRVKIVVNQSLKDELEFICRNSTEVNESDGQHNPKKE